MSIGSNEIDRLAREVAGALAATWRTAWTEYQEDFAADADVRDRARQHAWDLLGLAGRVWPLDRSPDVVDLGFAAAMLRELADGYALMSNTWTVDELSRLPFPVRDWLNIVFGALELDEWCARYDAVLELDEVVPQVTWGPLPLSAPADDLDRRARLALRRYRSLVTQIERGPEPDLPLRRREELRAQACVDLADARRDVFALRVAGSDESEVSVASVRVMLAESTFLLTSAADSAAATRLPIIHLDLLPDLSAAFGASADRDER